MHALLCMDDTTPKLYSVERGISRQGVIQDFEVEGGNKKSNQKMLLKKRSTVISIPLYSM